MRYLGPRVTRAIAMALLLAIPAASRGVETYVHDTQGRLTDVTYENASSIHYVYDANGNLLTIVSSFSSAGVDPSTPESFQFALGTAAPNPGSGPRTIRFSIASPGRVTLRVTDVAGRTAATLYDRELDPGRYVASFDSGRWPAGVYFCRLQCGGRTLGAHLVVAH
jgi:YD repeat-containing protein